MRIALCLVLLAATVASAAEETPTADEKKAIDAVAKLGGKATINTDLHKDARVAVKFDTATDATLNALAKHPQVGSIQAIDGRKCTDKGFTALAGLPHLHRLTLNQSGVTDAELTAIAKSQTLRVLVIPSSTVTDDGCAALEKLPRLEHLDLSDNPKLTDKAMAHVKTLERLELLHLNKTGLTDLGLFELRGLEGLRSLTVAGSKVTADAAAKFADAMPNLRVVRR